MITFIKYILAYKTTQDRLNVLEYQNNLSSKRAYENFNKLFELRLKSVNILRAFEDSVHYIPAIVDNESFVTAYTELKTVVSKT